MQRIGIVGFLHETNTFSNTPTPLENFLNQSGFYPEMLAGKEMQQFSEGKINIAASGFMADADMYEFSVVPLVWIGTEPSQPMKIDVFEHLMGLIEGAIEENQPYDGIVLDQQVANDQVPIFHVHDHLLLKAVQDIYPHHHLS